MTNRRRKIYQRPEVMNMQGGSINKYLLHIFICCKSGKRYRWEVKELKDDGSYGAPIAFGHKNNYDDASIVGNAAWEKLKCKS